MFSMNFIYSILQLYKLHPMNNLNHKIHLVIITMSKYLANYQNKFCPRKFLK